MRLPPWLQKGNPYSPVWYGQYGPSGQFAETILGFLADLSGLNDPAALMYQAQQRAMQSQQMATQQSFYTEQLRLAQEYDLRMKDEMAKKATALVGDEVLAETMTETDRLALKHGFTWCEWYRIFGK